MYKKITFFALFISIVGFLVEFFNNFDSTIIYILDYFAYNIATGADIFWVKGNLLRLFFNFLLFIGALTFYFSKEKETRLLRFVFSVLFVEQCFFVVLRVIRIYFAIKSFTVKDYFIYFASFGLTIFVLYFLYKSMKYLNEQKALDFETFVYTESTEISYFKTNNWQRLIHYIIDTVIFGIIGFQFLDFLIHLQYFNDFFITIQNQFSERVIFWGLVIIFRTIFYFAFEALFNATPGKFLTESRVVDEEGLVPDNSSLVKRTLFRSIPFNPLSFLFNADWHDQYSSTQVCKEKKTGFTGKLYFLIIPAFAIFYFGMHWWEIKRERDRFYEADYKEFEGKKSTILDALRVIDTNTVLQLKKGDSNELITFLKIQNISNNAIEFLILPGQYQSIKLSVLEETFAQSKDTLQKIKINKSDLQKMVITEFQEWPKYYYGNDKRSFKGISKIPQLEGKNIDDVLVMGSPNLVVAEADSDSNGVGVYLQNRGIPAEVISVTSDDKNIDWNLNMLPSKFQTFGTVYLRAKGKDFEGYKMNVTINDSLNKKFVYEVSSTDDPKKVNLRLIR